MGGAAWDLNPHPLTIKQVGTAVASPERRGSNGLQSIDPFESPRSPLLDQLPLLLLFSLLSLLLWFARSFCFILLLYLSLLSPTSSSGGGIASLC